MSREIDMSSMPVVERASGLVHWDCATGWIPQRGDGEELIEFCNRIIDRLAHQDVDTTDRDTVLAIFAGISIGLDEIYLQNTGETFN